MEKTLEFLSELKTHNDQAWFMDHIGDYERAKTELADLAYSLLEQLSILDPALNNEIDVSRFISSLVISKPKKSAPYRTYFDLSISPLLNGGNEPVYRIHIDPEGSYFGILFEPDVFGLQVMRSYISKNISQLEAGLFSAFSGGFALTESKTWDLPKGYPAGVTGEQYIKLRHYELRCPIDLTRSRAELLTDISSSYALTLPFVEFLRKGLGL